MVFSGSARLNNFAAQWTSECIWSFVLAARSPYPNRGKGFRDPPDKGDNLGVGLRDTRTISAAYGSSAYRDLDLKPLALLGSQPRIETWAAGLSLLAQWGSSVILGDVEVWPKILPVRVNADEIISLMQPPR